MLLCIIYNVYSNQKGGKLLKRDRKKYFEERRRKVKRLTIDITDEEKEKLRLITEKENTSITQWIKKQIKEYNL